MESKQRLDKTRLQSLVHTVHFIVFTYSMFSVPLNGVSTHGALVLPGHIVPWCCLAGEPRLFLYFRPFLIEPSSDLKLVTSSIFFSFLFFFDGWRIVALWHRGVVQCTDKAPTPTEELDNMFHQDKHQRSGALGIPEFLGVLTIMMVFVFGTLIAHFIRHPAHVLTKIFIYMKICCGCCGSGRRASQRKSMLEDGRAGGKTKKKSRADTKAAAFRSKPKLKDSEAISISSI